jgi:integrase
VFGLRILDDYARMGNVVRLVVVRNGLRIPQAMQKPMHDYEQFAKERCHLRMSSLQGRMHAIAVFLDFLRSRGVTTLDRMPADFLGHVDVKTTQTYARSNLEMKRRALEKVVDTPLPTIPSWQQNKTLLDWLHSL